MSVEIVFTVLVLAFSPLFTLIALAINTLIWSVSAWQALYLLPTVFIWTAMKIKLGTFQNKITKLNILCTISYLYIYMCSHTYTSVTNIKQKKPKWKPKKIQFTCRYQVIINIFISLDILIVKVFIAKPFTNLAWFFTCCIVNQLQFM